MAVEANIAGAGSAGMERSGFILGDGPGDLIVLHALSRQEKALARDLDAMGVAHWLPMTRTVRYYGRRKVHVQLPLFPGYLFMRGAMDDAYRADRTRRVAQVITVPDQDQLIRDLAAIEQVQVGGGELEPAPFIRVGTEVEVGSGPFKGVVGLVDEVAGQGRLILRIRTLGQAASLEIDSGLLIRVDQAESRASN